MYYLHPQSHKKLRLEKQGRLICSLDITMPSKKCWIQYCPSPLIKSAERWEKLVRYFMWALCSGSASVPQAWCAQASREVREPCCRRLKNSHQPLSEIPAGATVNLSDTVQIGELIPLLLAKAVAMWGGQRLPFPADEEGDASSVDFFRSAILSYKHTKHLALLPPVNWTSLSSLLCLNMCLAGRLLLGAFPSLSCVLDSSSCFILSSFLLKGLPLGSNICIINISQVFLLLPTFTPSDPPPYHFSLLFDILIQYRT